MEIPDPNATLTVVEARQAHAAAVAALEQNRRERDGNGFGGMTVKQVTGRLMPQLLAANKPIDKAERYVALTLASPDLEAAVRTAEEGVLVARRAAVAALQPEVEDAVAVLRRDAARAWAALVIAQHKLGGYVREAEAVGFDLHGKGNVVRGDADGGWGATFPVNPAGVAKLRELVERGVLLADDVADLPQ